MSKRMSSVAAVALALASGDVANADSKVRIDGLLEQIVTVDEGITMEQDLTGSSLQAINLVAARDGVRIDGEVRQKVEATRLEMTQKRAIGSIQAINAIVAGNPMTQLP